jgi:hypothetical protein
VTRLVALYPRAWRDRYEEEFLALLADRPPDPVGRLDIVRGAVDARLHPQVAWSPDPTGSPAPGSPWRVRAGWLTLLGGLLWIVAMVIAANGPLIVESWGSYRDGAAAAPFWSVALLLLGTGMVAVALDQPAPARAARAAALVSAVVGLLWALTPWLFYAGLIAFAALVVVAVSAWRSDRWSGLELGILLVGVVVPWAMMLVVGSGLWAPPGLGPDLQYIVIGSLVLVWVVIGASLVRAPRARPVRAVSPRA